MNIFKIISIAILAIFNLVVIGMCVNGELTIGGAVTASLICIVFECWAAIAPEED